MLVLGIFGLFLVLCLVIGLGCCFSFGRGTKPVSCWSRPYECGFLSCSRRFDSFGFSYFSLLVFFVIFDLEVSLLLNMPGQGLLFDNYWFYLLFLLILSLGFLSEVVWGYVQ
jgi:NADH:ubiquinone oxidoreductase subunit 3 (subunit A)